MEQQIEKIVEKDHCVKIYENGDGSLSDELSERESETKKKPQRIWSLRSTGGKKRINK